MVEETTLHQAWGALRVALPNAFTFYEIKEIAGLAGIDITRLAGLVQHARGGASKGRLITALDQEIASLDHREKFRVLNYMAEEIVARRPEQSGHLEECLRRLGWQFEDGHLIPLELFDVAELAELPDPARADLAKAATRLRDGDLSGALARRLCGGGFRDWCGLCRASAWSPTERQLPKALYESIGGQ